MKTIRFNTRGSSSAFGNFAPGDILTCGDAEAAHFVDEACCATYVEDQSAEGSKTVKAEGKANAAKRANKADKTPPAQASAPSADAPAAGTDATTTATPPAIGTDTPGSAAPAA